MEILKISVRDFAEKLDMKILTDQTVDLSDEINKSEHINILDREIKGIYSCDLLSWVMSRAEKNIGWITVHTHLNIVAVASLLEISAIIVPESIGVEEATIKKAIEEGISILSSGMDAYEICWRAHEILS